MGGIRSIRKRMNSSGYTERNVRKIQRYSTVVEHEWSRELWETMSRKAISAICSIYYTAAAALAAVTIMEARYL